jgi:hypothetical protein
MRTMPRLVPQAGAAVAAEPDTDHSPTVGRLRQAGRLAAIQGKIGKAHSHGDRERTAGEALAVLAVTDIDAERRGMDAEADGAADTATGDRKGDRR